MSRTTKSPPFYIHVKSSFDGVIKSLADLASMPRLSGNQVNLGVILNSQMRNGDLLTQDEAINTLGWTSDEWNLAYGKRGFRAVPEAWSGAAYDPTRRRLMLHGCGHALSGFNSVHPFDLNQIGNAATDMWPRLVNPSRTAQGRTSPYPDGTPPASHSYGHLAYDAVTDSLVEPAKGVYDPEQGYDGPGRAGTFVWLPLADLTNDPEANLGVWQVYFPSGDPEAGHAKSIGYENAWAGFDPNTGLVIGHGPGKSMRYVPDYQAKTNDWVAFGSGKNSCYTRAFSCLNPDTREVWTMGRQDFGASTAAVDGPAPMQVVDISDAPNSAPGEIVTLTGDVPNINGIGGFQSGTNPAKVGQTSDMFCTLTYSNVAQGAVFWFPLYVDKTYMQDGVELTEAEKVSRSLQLSLVTPDKVCRNLTIVENGAAQMPRWTTSLGEQESVSGGPYDRFTYIEEFDVVLYVHSWATDALVLKLPGN